MPQQKDNRSLKRTQVAVQPNLLQPRNGQRRQKSATTLHNILLESVVSKLPMTVVLLNPTGTSIFATSLANDEHLNSSISDAITAHPLIVQRVQELVAQ
eukprot:scaffold15467_cov71-Cyclotella_meneghiniana.AAC.1